MNRNDFEQLVALALAHLPTRVRGSYDGFWNWLCFVAPVMLGSVLWEGKSVKLYSLNAAYYLVNLCAMGVILAVWQ